MGYYEQQEEKAFEMCSCLWYVLKVSVIIAIVVQLIRGLL